MSDKQFTFLQMHFHDGIQLGPDRISTGGSDDDEPTDANSAPTDESAPAPATESDSSGPGLLGPLLGFGALAAVVAYAVRKLLAGTDTEGLDALDDVDESENSVPIEITTPEEESSGSAGLVVAGVVGLLLVLAVAAKKLLSGSEEIVVEE